MEPGDVVADRFVIERLAGRGGMGTVWRVLDRRTEAPVALKLIAGRGLEDLVRFEREAELLAELTHPAIVRYVAHGRSGAGQAFLALEWLEGEDLAQRLAREGLSVAEGVALASRMAEALGAIHARGVVHRDLKPSNVFLPGGEVTHAKLLDFGVARRTIAAAPSTATGTGTVVGTPAYMAPEQARGERDVDARSDLFALGCVLFESLTGRPAFLASHVMAVLAKVLFEDPPRLLELRPDLPPPLDELCARMLQKAPDARPRSAGEIAAALGALGAIGWTPTAPATQPRGGSLTTSERRILAVVLAATTPASETLDAAPTLAASEALAVEDALRAAAAEHDGRAELLADGSLVVVLAARAGAVDQAGRAARCALAIRRLLPAAPIALATGRGVLAERWPLGEVIDRATALLAAARRDVARGAADAARVAARGERSEPASQRALPVRIDETTAGLLDARFDVGGDGAGLLLMAVADAPPAARTLLGRPSPCVGRENELAMLGSTLDQCVEEPCARAVVVTAGPGVGKSRLSAELYARVDARADRVQVWVSRGEPMRAGSPFGVVAGVLRSVCGFHESEPIEVRRRKLRARLGRHLAPEVALRAARFLGEIAGASFPDEGVPELTAARADPIVLGEQVRRAWLDLLGAETAAGPLMVVLEDLHWGDLPSVRLVDAALSGLRDRPLFVLALARPEIAELFPRLWEDRSTRLGLRELGRRSAERLVREALGDGVPANVVASLVERSGGNAFYLEELVRAVSDAAAAGREAPVAVPETVLAMAEARIERLEIEARRVLRAASVFGDVLWEGGLAALLGGVASSVPVGEWLAELVRREVLEVRRESRSGDEPTYAFRHALVREAAYAMLTDADRRLGHRLAGEWLERRGETDAMALAEHFDRGGEPGRAFGWYRRAAEQAFGGNDLDAALSRIARAEACGGAGEELAALEVLRADVALWRGENGEAYTAARAALRAAKRGGAPWFAGVGRTLMAAGRAGRFEALDEMAAELDAVAAERAPGPEAVVASSRLVVQLYYVGRNDDAARLLGRTEQLAATIGALDDATLAWLENARAWRALCAGDVVLALRLDQETVACFERAGDLRNACHQRSGAGYELMRLGALEEAEQTLRRAHAEAAAMGLAAVASAAAHNLGLALAWLGRFEEARAEEEAAVRGFSERAAARMESAAHAYLAMILALAGDAEGAEGAARRAAALAGPWPPMLAFAMAVLARALVGRADPAALDAARESVRLADEVGAEGGDVFVRLALAEALDACGDREAARAAIAEARRKLLEQADAIRDPALRASFLERIPEHARTLELASRWGACG